MKLLLIVGTAKDVFIYHMAKWLKHSMKDVEIDVFEFSSNDQQNFDYKYYDKVATAQKNWCNNTKYVRHFLADFQESSELNHFLKGTQYDIIQCHWIRPAVVLSGRLKEHCKKLVVTFWGGELESLKIFSSKFLYKKKLGHFLRKVDCILNSEIAYGKIRKYFPDYNGDFHEAKLGAASLDYLYDILGKETKQNNKISWGFPTDKFSVLIGYSGKNLHQHLKIIDYFNKNKQLVSSVHLVAIMTRGCECEYSNQVENALKESGYTYTFIKGRYLSDQEIASFRFATDIALQLSIFDGFSRSIVECLCAQTIVIYGAWLNYDYYLKKEGFKAFSVLNFEAAFNLLSDIVSNYNSYFTLVSNNKTIGKSNTWEECISDWIEAYKL